MSYMEMRKYIAKATHAYVRGLLNVSDLEQVLAQICVRYRRENMPAQEVA